MTSPVNSSSAPIDASEVPDVAIQWDRSLPWWRFLSHSITISWRLSHLLDAALGIWLMSLGWQLANQFFGGPLADPVGSVGNRTMLDVPLWLSDSASWLFLHKNPNPFVEVARWTLGVLWTVGVWGLLGGVLARRSVIELATISSSSWIEAWKLVGSRWLSILRSVTLPWLLILAMLFPTWILGLIARLGDVGLWIANLGLVVLIPFMVGVAWLLVQSFIGFPLSLCAIVTERKADAFDGFSRSAAYLLQRPFTVIAGVAVGMLIMTTVGSLLSWSFELAQRFFADNMLWVSGRDSMTQTDWSRVIVQKIGQSFAASFFWTASAALYLMLRNEVDMTDFDDLDLPTASVSKSLPDLGKPPSVENNPDLSGANETAE